MYKELFSVKAGDYVYNSGDYDKVLRVSHDELQQKATLFLKNTRYNSDSVITGNFDTLILTRNPLKSL